MMGIGLFYCYLVACQLWEAKGAGVQVTSKGRPYGRRTGRRTGKS
jgi:hypothetical protein